VQNENAASPSEPRRRPWLAPLIATLLALAVLLVLLIPGILRYPAPRAGTAADSLEEQTLRASNDLLELQLKALKDAAQNASCRPANLTIPVPNTRSDSSGPSAGSAQNQEPLQMEVIPTPPEHAPIGTGQAAANQPASTVGKLLDNSTVLVVVLQHDQYAQGTGFFISDRNIVTNHHVIQHAKDDNIFVVGRGIGGIKHARLVAKSSPAPSDNDITADVAVLEVEPSANAQKLKLGITPTKLSTAYVAGFPGFITDKDTNFRNFMRQLIVAMGARNMDTVLAGQTLDPPSADLRYGRINNTMKSGTRQLPILIHDMQLAPGNSGGPLVDACGRLGGINTALFENTGGTQQGNVAQDVSVVRDFLRRSNIAFEAEDNPCNPVVAANETPAPPPAPGNSGPPNP
jgi:S1-C subfamily serine protease